MNCPNCGNNVSEGAVFCTNCGTNLSNVNTTPEQPVQEQPVQAQQVPNNYQQPVQEQPVQTQQIPNNYQQSAQNYQQPQQNYYQQPAQQQPNYGMENPSASKALVFGILSLCLCWLPVASIVLGIFAVKFGNETLRYSLQGYNKRPMGIIAKVFGIVSIVLCAIFTIYWTIFCIALCVAATNALPYATTYSYYF